MGTPGSGTARAPLPEPPRLLARGGWRRRSGARRAGPDSADTVSPEVLIRPATARDAPAIRDLHARCVGDAFAGLLGDALPSAEQRAERERTWAGEIGAPRPRHALLVAERAGRVVGFVAVGPTRDDDGDRQTVAELRTVMVDAAQRGTGAGRALMAAGERAMAESGFALATLWVVPANEPAVRCYERAGWRPDGTERVQDVNGREIRSVRYVTRLAD